MQEPEIVAADGIHHSCKVAALAMDPSTTLHRVSLTSHHAKQNTVSIYSIQGLLFHELRRLP